MVSKAVYKVVVRAAGIRIERGEDPNEVVESYVKLSPEQKKQLRKDLGLDTQQKKRGKELWIWHCYKVF